MVLSKPQQERIYEKFRYYDKHDRVLRMGGFPNKEHKNFPYLFDKLRNKYPDEQGLKFYYPDGYDEVRTTDGTRIYHKNGFRFYKREWYKKNYLKIINYSFLDHRGLNCMDCRVVGEGRDEPQTYGNGDYFPQGRSYIKLKSI